MQAGGMNSTSLKLFDPENVYSVGNMTSRCFKEHTRIITDLSLLIPFFPQAYLGEAVRQRAMWTHPKTP